MTLIKINWQSGCQKGKHYQEDSMVDQKSYQMYVILGGFTLHC